MVESFRDGLGGVLRRPENQPMTEAVVAGGGESGKRRWEGTEMKEVIVAVSNSGVVSSPVAEEG